METTPAKAEDREKQHLPPKSYAAAVEEVATKTDKKYPSTNNRKVNGKSPSMKTSVLRIVNTNGQDSEKSERSDRSAPEEDEDERIGRPRMEKHEYSAEVYLQLSVKGHWANDLGS